MPKLPKMIDPMKDLADNAAAIMPVMNGFKGLNARNCLLNLF
jgi:hypothetical protein